MKIIRKRGLQGVRIEHNKKLLYVIIFLLALLAVIICSIIVRLNEDEELIGGDTDEHGCVLMGGYNWCEPKQKCLRTWEEPCYGECDIDSVCVPASCCHATECVHKSQAPDCSDIFCTEVCEPETLDCGGECRCVENKCEAFVG